MADVTPDDVKGVATLALGAPPLFAEASPPEPLKTGPGAGHRCLFHYTKMQGLLGICSSKPLWATNIHYPTIFLSFRKGLPLLISASDTF